MEVRIYGADWGKACQELSAKHGVFPFPDFKLAPYSLVDGSREVSDQQMSKDFQVASRFRPQTDAGGWMFTVFGRATAAPAAKYLVVQMAETFEPGTPEIIQPRSVFEAFWRARKRISLPEGFNRGVVEGSELRYMFENPPLCSLYPVESPAYKNNFRVRVRNAVWAATEFVERLHDMSSIFGGDDLDSESLDALTALWKRTMFGKILSAVGVA